MKSPSFPRRASALALSGSVFWAVFATACAGIQTESTGTTSEGGEPTSARPARRVSSASRSAAEGEKSTSLLIRRMPLGLNHKNPDLVVEGQDERLRLTVDRPKVVHFEYAPRTSNRAGPIPTTVMVLDEGNAPKAPEVQVAGSRVETERFSVTTDRELCFSVERSGEGLATICPSDGGVRISDHFASHAYGLGQNFVQPQQFGDVSGRVRAPGGPYGSAMTKYESGFTGDTQMPLLVAVGEGDQAFGLFIDTVEAQTWDLSSRDWNMTSPATTVRGFFVEGESALDVRKTLMSLLGTSPVPPRSAFGLWLSEYGFDNAAEAEEKIGTLHAAKFPLDGIVLDLQWFGDFEGMGSLTFDETRFPDPGSWIRKLEEARGVSVMTIEESYVREELPEYTKLSQAGALVKSGSSDAPVHFDTWWGKGSMIDWTNEAAAAAWHAEKRAALIDLGIVGHWTDLGEPETFDPKGRYAGGRSGRTSHAANHNLFNLYWAKSIAEGYSSGRESQRPFILSRSGAPGIQRYGAALWSGDIATNAQSLDAHFDAQTHMAFSGIDYYGSDIGGFHRNGVEPEALNELYTYWFASSALMDVPVRPHTLNRWGGHETAPDRVGDRSSNLANIRQRYELLPYYYSLAHRAWLFAEPVISPLALYFASDEKTRELYDHKLIGESLLALVASSGTEAKMYFPRGRWCDYRTGRWLESSGEERAVRLVDEHSDVRLPLFVKEGAIVPTMEVDEELLNSSGRRRSGVRNEMQVYRIYPSEERTSFTLFEDDGKTVGYQNGQVRTTLIEQSQRERRILVTVHASRGAVPGLSDSRPERLEIFAELNVLSARLNGDLIPFTRGPQGQVILEIADAPVSQERRYELVGR